jgi:hypothetical protein
MPVGRATVGVTVTVGVSVSVGTSVSVGVALAVGVRVPVGSGVGEGSGVSEGSMVSVWVGWAAVLVSTAAVGGAPVGEIAGLQAERTRTRSRSTKSDLNWWCDLDFRTMEAILDIFNPF